MNQLMRFAAWTVVVVSLVVLSQAYLGRDIPGFELPEMDPGQVVGSAVERPATDARGAGAGPDEPAVRDCLAETPGLSVAASAERERECRARLARRTPPPAAGDL